MSLEGFSERGMELGDNIEGTKETINNVRKEYLNAIKRLALKKIKNDLLFEGSLGAVMRNLSSLGLNISKESMLKDIEAEISRQRIGFDIELPNISMEEPNLNIENQSNVLNNIFETKVSTQEQIPINISGTISREPAIGLVAGAGDNRLANLRELRELQEKKEPIPVYTEEEKQEIRNQMQQAQEKIKQQLEWGKQQPNVPQYTSTQSDTIEASPEWTKDNGISGYTEPSLEQVRDGLEQTKQEQNFDKIYDLEIKKLTELKKSNNPSYEMELANAMRRISSLTDRIPNIREQLESDIDYEMSIATKDQTSNQEQQQINQVESKETLQEQQVIKNKMIDQIMNRMNMTGEFSFGDISMSERMSIMQNVQNKLNIKSMDELQMILSSYQEQNIQDETMHTGMHR